MKVLIRKASAETPAWHGLRGFLQSF